METAAAQQGALGLSVAGTTVVLAISFLFWKIGGDRPEVEKLGTLEDIYGEAGSPQIRHEKTASYWTIVRSEVFTNPVVLILAAINAMLYCLRFGILNWMPAFLGTEMGFSRPQYSMAFSTAFNVQLNATDLAVVVTEGQVSVASAPERATGAPKQKSEQLAPLLAAGQRARLAREMPTQAPVLLKVDTLTAGELDELLAWQATWLVFDGTPWRTRSRGSTATARTTSWSRMPRCACGG